MYETSPAMYERVPNVIRAVQLPPMLLKERASDFAKSSTPPPTLKAAATGIAS